MPKKVDLVGERFGRLTVLERAPSKPGRVRWRCRCDCGRETLVPTYVLRRAQGTRSCGCLVTSRPDAPIRKLLPQIEALRAQGVPWREVAKAIGYPSSFRTLKVRYGAVKSLDARKASDDAKARIVRGTTSEFRGAIATASKSASEIAAIVAMADRSVVRIRSRARAQVGAFVGPEGDRRWLQVRKWLWDEGASWAQIRNRLARDGYAFATATAAEIAWNDHADVRSGVVSLDSYSD